MLVVKKICFFFDVPLILHFSLPFSFDDLVLARLWRVFVNSPRVESLMALADEAEVVLFRVSERTKLCCTQPH